MYVHRAFSDAARLSGALKQIEEHVGAELVHRTCFVAGSQAPGYPIDPVGDGYHPVRREVQGKEVGGSRLCRGNRDSPVGDRPLIAAFRLGGVGLLNPLCEVSER